MHHHLSSSSRFSLYPSCFVASTGYKDEALFFPISLLKSKTPDQSSFSRQRSLVDYPRIAKELYLTSFPKSPLCEIPKTPLCSRFQNDRCVKFQNRLCATKTQNTELYGLFH
jgi:hypothetical protein